MVESYKNEDWWNDLSEIEKSEIEEGISQANEGNYVNHEIAMKVFEKWK